MSCACHPHADKIDLYLFTDEIYPDTDTDDKNSPNVIKFVPFFIRIRNADTDTDLETWNRAQMYCPVLYESCLFMLNKLFSVHRKIQTYLTLTIL